MSSKEEVKMFGRKKIQVILMTFNKELNSRLEKGKEEEKFSKLIDIVHRYDKYDDFLNNTKPLENFEGTIVFCDDWDEISNKENDEIYVDLVHVFERARKLGRITGGYILTKRTKEDTHLSRFLNRYCFISIDKDISTNGFVNWVNPVMYDRIITKKKWRFW